MRTLHARIAGDAKPVYIIGSIGDAMDVPPIPEGVPLAVDVETTGLDHYAPGWRVRTIQLGTREAAWVFQVERCPELLRSVVTILRETDRLLAHNASYDLQALDRIGVMSLEESWPKMIDTYLLAHLLDPRQPQDGATGHMLENLCKAYFDPSAHDHRNALLAHFKDQRWSKDEGYALVDLDEPTFLRYGGADVILTSWLANALIPKVHAGGWWGLMEFETNVARIMSIVQRKGILVDQGYAAQLDAYLVEKGERAEKTAASYGIENVNSTAQVAEVLVSLGAELTGKTKAGKPKVDKDVRAGLISKGGALAAVAQAVTDAKSAGKFRKAYVDNVMASLDEHGRVHPNIKSLQARTARMAVSDPPLHQIPSNDWRIRRLFIASEGHHHLAADYSQIELRVLGALAKDKAILAAVRDGIDLHDLTAERVGIARKVAKMTNFLIVYGGGAGKLSTSAAISLAEAKAAIQGFKRAYPGVTRYSRQLVERSEMGKLDVITATGRRLPLDRKRVYAATNYTVQSTSRDVLGQAAIDLEKAGLIDHVLLPIHDEFLGEASIEDAEEVARLFGEVMSMDILGTRLDAEGEVYGPSWGHGYDELGEMASLGLDQVSYKETP